MSDKSIKIIFFGNTEFSNPVLIKCAESYNVCSVVTNPSKKNGTWPKICRYSSKNTRKKL